jgi:glycosyltransferase involved in cell wall biosynthesis
MPTSSLVSIVIPVFNHAKALALSFQTIFAQDYRPIEVIIVDDGSTENLIPLKLEFEKLAEDHRVKLTWISQKNQGAAAARNAGFARAEGVYTIFWDADTIAQPTMLSCMAETLEHHPEATFVYSQFKFGWKTIFSHPFNTELLKQYNYIDTTSLILTADLVPFDINLKRFQDWDLWLTLAERGKTGVFIPKVLFTKLVGRRKGLSSWFPAWFLKLPWKTASVRDYEQARNILRAKHHL